MIDGVKLLCKGTDWRLWHDHDQLEFWASVNTKTGEIPQQTTVAKLDGLKFKLAPIPNYVEKYQTLLIGSLHRFWNGGNGNTGNYSLEDIKQTIGLLQNEFGVKTETAILQNLEFGLNIPLSISAKEFISNIISMPDKALTTMDIKTPSLGRVCDRTEYRIKLYDKILQQEKQRNGNILRVEIAAKKARFLEKFNIKVLADLTDPAKLSRLANYLLKVFNDLIYYDGSIKEKSLYRKELLKLKDFCSAYYWEKLNRSNRHKKRKEYHKMMLGFGANKVKNKALADMRILYQKLINGETEKSDVFTAFGAEKKATFSQLEYRVKTSLFENQKEESFKDNTGKKRSKIHNDELPPNCEENISPSIIKKCCTCGRDISHQKQTSKYCSEKYFGRMARKCRDAGYIKMRQTRRNTKRELEENNLVEVLHWVGVIDIQLIIFFSDGFSLETPATKVQIKPRFIRSVIKVEVLVNGSRFFLTTRRAKKLIKQLVIPPDS